MTDELSAGRRVAQVGRAWAIGGYHCGLAQHAEIGRGRARSPRGQVGSARQALVRPGYHC